MDPSGRCTRPMPSSNPSWQFPESKLSSFFTKIPRPWGRQDLPLVLATIPQNVPSSRFNIEIAKPPSQAHVFRTEGRCKALRPESWRAGFPSQNVIVTSFSLPLAVICPSGNPFRQEPSKVKFRVLIVTGPSSWPALKWPCTCVLGGRNRIPMPSIWSLFHSPQKAEPFSQRQTPIPCLYLPERV